MGNVNPRIMITYEFKKVHHIIGIGVIQVGLVCR